MQWNASFPSLEGCFFTLQTIGVGTMWAPEPVPRKDEGGVLKCRRAQKILGETTPISLDHTHFKLCGSITKVLSRRQHLPSVVLAGYCLSPASGLSRLGPAPAFLSAISCTQRACNHCALTRISVKGRFDRTPPGYGPGMPGPYVLATCVPPDPSDRRNLLLCIARIIAMTILYIYWSDE
jgi:hypothetical protein